MPGIFSKSARPKRPGAYFNFESDSRAIVPASTGSVVAVPFTHDWGPSKTATPVSSFAEWQSIFGNTKATPGYVAVKQAFTGEGVQGRGGAGTVIAYRTGSSSAAKATVSLSNTTPASALTLTARYNGTRGNALRATIQTNATDGTKKDLIILDGTVTLETYTILATDVTAFVAAINLSSQWVTATQVITGVALANVSASPFVGGNDGATLIAQDWTDLMAALEVERFSLFAPYDLTDGSIVTSVKAWALGLNGNGKRFLTVVGGVAAESVTTAATRAASLNDPNFVCLGVGTLTDAEHGDLSTSQLAPRVAGILASRGETASLTFARMAGTTIKVGPTQSQILAAFDAGVTVFSRDTDVNSPVRIEKGLTSYTTTTDSTRPYLIYRNPKYVRTMHGLENELTEWFESNIVGQASINDKTREIVLGEAKRRMKEREITGAVQAGSTVSIDQDPPPTDEDEFIALLYGMKFGRSLEQVYNTVKIS